MANEDTKFDLSHLTLLGIGAMAGAWWVKNQVDSAKLSRIERDDPELVEGVCTEVVETLENLELEGEFGHEDGYRDALAEYLHEKTGMEIEVAPATAQGQPDLLIEAALALEVKLLRTKSDMDRAVGQCAAYARDWVTWIITFDSPPSRVRALEQLLEDHGLERILVIDFRLEDDEDEEDDV